MSWVTVQLTLQWLIGLHVEPVPDLRRYTIFQILHDLPDLACTTERHRVFAIDLPLSP
jgi:hypothetical protein